MNRTENTREVLLRHVEAYPSLQTEDIFKFLFQSAFGCEHLVSDRERALDYLLREYKTVPASESPRIDPLDGRYSRVHLSCLNHGLRPETLTDLFCASAKKEPDGLQDLTQKIRATEELIRGGTIPVDYAEFNRKLTIWKERGFPAIHHSDTFREVYRPAYRVISNGYVPFLPLFTRIDRMLEQGAVTVAIEGGSAGGKSTLASLLQTIYGCTVIHMDDFFLRPEQRTPERFAEIGGNIDRERFMEEIILPLQRKETFRYSPFDCSTQTLGEPVTVEPNRLTVIEGVYSMHPAFGGYNDLSVFLDISPACQKERIVKRNPPPLANRFFGEWIPLENTYFSKLSVKTSADLVVNVE